jgi:thioredoxin-dependent peroxiredoxin
MAAKKKTAPAKINASAKPAPKAAATKAAKKAAPAAGKPAKVEAKPAKTDKPLAAGKAQPKSPQPAAAKNAPAKAAKSGAGDAGSKAPSFELMDEKGATVSSSALAGKPYLLYFYPKDDTPGCTKEACDIRDSFARFGKQGLRVLGVSPDSQQSHAKFGKKYGLPFTLLSDPDKTLANLYVAWGEKNNYGKKYMGIIRSSFLVGADGTIKKAYRGVKVPGHVDAVLEDAKSLL